MPRYLDHVKEAMDEAHKFGANLDYEIRQRNIACIISYNSKTQKLFISKTPSDIRAVLKIRCDVRKCIVKLGGAVR